MLNRRVNATRKTFLLDIVRNSDDPRILQALEKNVDTKASTTAAMFKMLQEAYGLAALGCDQKVRLTPLPSPSPSPSPSLSPSSSTVHSLLPLPSQGDSTDAKIDDEVKSKVRLVT